MPTEKPSSGHSKIRSAVNTIVEINPVTLQMTPEQMQDVHEKRQKEIEERYREPKDAEYATKLHSAHKIQEKIERSVDQLIDVSPDQLWMPVQRRNVLSGFLPIPPMAAQGGTSEIWICKSRFAERTLIIKLLTHPGSVVDLEPALALRELQTLFNLHHPNIINVYDAGYLKTPAGEFPYVAMEVLEGSNLHSWVLENATTLTATEAATIVAVIANAIQFCHENDIVHRDLKPHNVFINGTVATKDTIKVIDFGFAGSHSEMPIGATIGYSDPDPHDLQHHTAEHRDIYAIATILFFCVTKHDPPQNPDATARASEMEAAIVQIEDPIMKGIILKATRADVNERYESAGHMGGDLTRFANDFEVYGVGVHYSWFERVKLLVKRCRSKNDVADHSVFVGVMAMLLTVPLVVAGIAHVLIMALGFDPSTAFAITGRTLSVSVLPFLIFGGWVVRWRRETLRILEPMVALVAGIVLTFEGNMPATADRSNLKITDFASGLPNFVILLAVFHIFCGASIKRGNAIKLFGVCELVFAIFCAQLITHDWFVDYLPIPILSLEIVGCAAFALATAGEWFREQHS